MAWRGFGLGLGFLACAVAACGGKSIQSEGQGRGGTGGANGTGGSSVMGLGSSAGNAPAAGAGSAGKTSQGGGSGSPGEGGRAGEGSTEGGAAGAPAVGEPLSAGVIVVGTTVRGAQAQDTQNFVVLLDPSDGHEIARTAVALEVRGIAYEAARDKWFVFTGAPGLNTDDPTGPLLTGTMTSTGFDIEQTTPVPKPTNQNTIAVLGQRILYRTATHAGISVNDDVLTLLDTSNTPKPIGKLTIPYKYALLRSVARPAQSGAGGRVFFMHDNADDATDNCVNIGVEAACTVYESSLGVGAVDTNLSLSIASINSVTQIDRDASVAALDIQPSGSTAIIVTPPRRGVDTHASIYRFDATTGASLGAAIPFPLGTPSKIVNPDNPLTIPSVAVDPCRDRIFTSELDNTALLYSVPFDGTGSVTAFDPTAQNGMAGAVVYEPYTKTLLSFVADSPSISSFPITGTPAAPQFTTHPWNAPQGLVPTIVVVKNPVVPPC